MIDYDVKQWATMFRVSRLYLRALRRKKQQKSHQDHFDLDTYTLSKKVRECLPQQETTSCWFL